MKKKVYGLMKDPWPYDSVIDALLFFSMDEAQRSQYIRSGEAQVIEKGPSNNVVDVIVQGFAQYIRPGLNIEEWIDDANLEKIGLEEEFEKFIDFGMKRGTEAILKNWSEISSLSRRLLNILGWNEAIEPMTTAYEVLLDYKHHDLGGGWGW